MGLFSKKKNNENKDREAFYNNIDSLQKAIVQFKKKRLSKLYLFPIEFGGPEDVRNIVYVPNFVVEAKISADRTVRKLLEEGLADNYSCSPEYKGKSFIPSKLIINGTGKRTFNYTIDIW